ncbi:MAG TPA: dihydropteroate synthase [Candidatus Aminicenantes bacterium]|mgnify:CR=1 FL=1|nr:dihydropteroate synthase [Candidatus Aminicenantes bacterium]
MILRLRDRTVEREGPWIMGILNTTPDSFSDGGSYMQPEAALRQAEALVLAGADIVDVGGESTRPGSAGVSLEEEMDRVLPVVERIRENFDALISVDTTKASLARAAVEEGGANLVNDISALRFDERMGETVARLGVPVVLMHMKGTPGTMQQAPEYTDVIGEVKDFFAERIESALAAGISREKLILDPGFGFGKRQEDNLALLRRLAEFRVWEFPLLVGLSRKTFLGRITGEERPSGREIETVTAGVLAVLAGADLLRVHDVRATRKALAVLQAVRGG